MSALRYPIAYPIKCAIYLAYKCDQSQRPLPAFHRISPCLQAPAQLPQYVKLSPVKVPCNRTEKEICGGEAGF